jgi:Protein of unknown function (DUF2934)
MRATTKKRVAFRSVQGTMAVGSQKPIELLDGMWERISRKAYELWEARGRREGREIEDWLDAEAIVMEEIHEARE